MTKEEVEHLAMAAFLAARKLEGVTDAMAYEVKDAVIEAAEHTGVTMDMEGAICDECGSRIGPHGCCATRRANKSRMAKLEQACEAAVILMRALGGDDGYFPTAGATKTNLLRRRLRDAGYKIVYLGADHYAKDPIH